MNGGGGDVRFGDGGPVKLTQENGIIRVIGMEVDAGAFDARISPKGQPG